MKTALIVAFLFMASHTVQACELWLLSSCVPYKVGIHAKRFPLPSYSPMMANPVPGIARSVFGLNTFIIPSNDFLQINDRTYNSRFAREAVFCRMENYMLNTTGIKVCVRAGGYRER